MSEGTFRPDPVEPGTNGHTASMSGDDNLNRFLEETLGSVLRSAKESAAEMMQRAKRATEEETLQTHRLHEDAQLEVDRMTAWRAQVQPLVHAANEKAERIQRAVADAPGRMADALGPVNDALADMGRVMASLTEALRPPADGPSGSGGPSGGSTSFGSLGHGLPMVEPVRERIGAALDQTDDVSDDEDAAAEAEAEAEAEDAVAASNSTAEDDGAEGTAAERAPMGAPSSQAEDPSSGVSTPRWVDWPSNDASGDASSPASEARGHEINGGRATPDDEDDEALMSTRTQLRRAVTDIDWNDLPSASSG